MVHNNFLKYLGKEPKIGKCPVIFMLPLLRMGFFNRGETRADLKCKGKDPSKGDKLTIDVIGVFRMSIQSSTKLVGIGSKSDDWH